MSAVAVAEIAPSPGAQEIADQVVESEIPRGNLLSLTMGWEDVQRTRLAFDQRGLPSDDLKRLEARLGRDIRKELERHPIWPWLSRFPGLGGVHTARLIALIGDPWRFPGRICDAGHHHSAADAYGEDQTGRGCGVELADGTVCTAPVGPVRRGTGVRSLWHYLGLHVVDGHSPRKAKGQRADWNPRGRTCVLMPGGIAEQIVRQRVPRYRDIYDSTKERLQSRAAGDLGSAEALGPAIHAAEADPRIENDVRYGLRPIQIDAIARKVAAKAFMGDLLIAWKNVGPKDSL